MGGEMGGSVLLLLPWFGLRVRYDPTESNCPASQLAEFSTIGAFPSVH